MQKLRLLVPSISQINQISQKSTKIQSKHDLWRTDFHETQNYSPRYVEKSYTESHSDR